ncbi:MAG TPA: DUF3168 domain-containing protein [Methylomirabilota bacterium]|nr:DUF3168 domain-containing protein [Methylomirabilota bacterium]
MSVRQASVLAGLQASLSALFSADAELMDLVGGRIHDGAPKAAVPPYLAFADMRGRDFSGGAETGVRASLTLEAVTADDRRSRALATIDRAVALALAGPVEPGEGTLVLLRLDTTAVTRLKDNRGWRAAATLDALVDG